MALPGLQPCQPARVKGKVGSGVDMAALFMRRSAPSNGRVYTTIAYTVNASLAQSLRPPLRKGEGPRSQRETVVQPALLAHSIEMRAYRASADIEFPRDFLVAAALQQQHGDFPFPRGRRDEQVGV